MLRSLRRALIGSCLFGVVSCLAPTLPLPPPAHPSVEGPDADGQVRLSGNVLPNAQAVAINPRTDQIAGQLTGSDGAFDFRIGAQVGDTLNFFYMTKARTSPPLTITVRARPSPGP